MITTLIVMFFVGYLAIALEHPLRVDKTAIALVLGMLLWVIYALCADRIVPQVEPDKLAAYIAQTPSLQGESLHSQALSYVLDVKIVEALGDITQTLFFLIGAMTIVELVDVHGGFSIITDHIKTRSKGKLMWILLVTAFVFSAVLDNMTTTIVMIMLLRKLVDSLYTRNDIAPKAGNFRVKGDTVDVYLAYSEELIRITFWDDEIDGIEEVDAVSGMRMATFDEYKIYPANLFLTSKETQELAIRKIQDDLVEQVELLQSQGKSLEAKRLNERVSYDIEMIRELGHCSGIENYSRYFDGRAPGSRPYCLLDFFPEDFLIVIDESHVSVPQISAMYGGDRSRKESLVNYGFRLPAALDNRPLTFDEFHEMAKQVIYISATPADYELAESEGVVVEQIIRPTGLLDPPIEVRPADFPIDDLMEEIRKCIERDERTLVTTLTKRMAEELTAYLIKNGVRTAYIHSDVDTLERVQIMEDLRRGIYSVLVGVNLLREGLDLPEVALVAILDADKEGFLRSHRSLTQTAGRAARNVNGRVIMYANKITPSMQQTIDETERRRMKQLSYNEMNGITPKQVCKSTDGNELTQLKKNSESRKQFTITGEWPVLQAAEAAPQYGKAADRETSEQRIESLRQQMKEAAARLDFVLAAQLRDEMLLLEKQKNSMK